MISLAARLKAVFACMVGAGLVFSAAASAADEEFVALCRAHKDMQYSQGAAMCSCVAMSSAANPAARKQLEEKLKKDAALGPEAEEVVNFCRVTVKA